MSTIGGAVIRANLDRVRARVEAAARASGRAASDVTIVGVTKAVGIPEAAALIDAGVVHLGENRPEQLATRAAAPELASARWHLIGTYQRRKVRDTLAPVAFVHSVDSIPLASTLSDRACALFREVDCLVQVNVSGEASKHGYSPQELPKALEVLRVLPGLRWRGLMTMAPEAASLPECRRIFAATRELRDRVRDARLPLHDLSMGMSRDYAEAVLEGATLVRIGTALFEPPGEGGLG
jgi:pyridoxal phosphate enzyme (YggS family)